MTKLIVVRHGQSQWNLENRFTGWVDVDLTETGKQQAKQAAHRLIQAGLGSIDIAYTSRLKRAIRTLWIILEQLDRVWIDVHRHWQLNERHYGALQGLNKEETAQKYGHQQVHTWRRSYAIAPEPLSTESPMYPGNDGRYQAIPKEQLPTTESLRDVRERIIPLWQSTIAPGLASGRLVLIAAHGNSLRALAMFLLDMTPEEIMEYTIPTGVPLVFDMRNENRAGNMHFLGGDTEAE